jgi:iron complex outermembrane recepter protein
VKSLNRALLCGASAVFVYSLMPVAYAQEAVETVTVTGIRESLRDALTMKQNSTLITDNISTKDIGELPDITIGEELNRLPGVNTQRDRGNASQIAIRGLGPRFVFGLVNGREVASSEPSQNVRYESYPSEILAAAQVYKTQDATLIPGGIAATIDIRTTSPLDYNGPTLQLRGGPSYNTEAEKLPNYGGIGYRGSAAYITHLTDNFAFAIAGSIQREKNGYPNLSFWTENTNQPDTLWGDPANLTGNDPTKLVNLPNGTTGLTGGNPAPWGGQTEVKELQQDRYGLAGAMEWRATPDLVIKADGLWSSYIISEYQIQQWYDYSGTAWNAGNWYACDSTSVTAGIIDNAELAACTSSGIQFGNNGIPGAPATGGAAYWYTNGNSTFKVDSMGHVIQASLNAGGTDGVNEWNTVDIQNNLARYWQRQTLIVGGLNFDWTHGQWNAKLDLSHSEAWRNNQWLDFQTTRQFAATTGFNMAEGTKPYVISSLDPAVPANNTAAYSSGSRASGGATWCNNCLDAGPEMTRDHISAAAIDVTRAVDGSFITAIDFGGRISERQKSHHQYDYSIFYSSPTSPAVIPASDLREFTLTGFASVPQMLYGKWDTVAPLAFGDMKNTLPAGLGGAAGDPYLQAASWTTATVQGATAANDFDNRILRWQVQEVTYEGYGKVEFAHDFGGLPMTGGMGVRIDDISTTSTGSQTLDGGTTFIPIKVTNHYTDVLPSLNLNFHVADDQLVRFGASLAQSRPPLDTLNTGYTLNPSTSAEPANNTGGNPKLKPYRASNLDLDYEWYFHEESMFSVAAYYKHIMNYIGSAVSQQTFGGTIYDITSPVNAKGGDLEGIEFTLQTRFYFLPDFFKDFGIYTNASFVTSNIKELHPMLNPYSMGGLAKNSDEIDLFYDRGGFEARVAGKYHSSFTMIPGWASGQLDTLDAEFTLDSTLSYQWNDNIGFRLQGLNLTNQVTRFSGGRQGGDALRGSNDPNDLAAYSVFGRTFMFDISYKN